LGERQMSASFEFADAKLKISADSNPLKRGLDAAEKRAVQYTERANRQLERQQAQWGKVADASRRYTEKAHGHIARMTEAVDRRMAAMASSAEKQVARVGKSFASLAKFAAGGLAVGGAAAGAGAFGIGKLGIDAVESENLFKVSLGKFEADARRWSEAYSKLVRDNPFETRKRLGTLDNFMKSMGMDEGSSLKWSKQLVSLTNDISSFYNIGRDEAFQKTMSGLAGEIEPLRRLGISLTDDQLKAYALSHGIVQAGAEDEKIKAKLLKIDAQRAALDRQMAMGQGNKYGGARERAADYEAKLLKLQAQRDAVMDQANGEGKITVQLTEQQKLAARLGLYFERTKSAQGDLLRTLNSPANLLRGMWANAQGSLTKIAIPFMQEGGPVQRLLDALAKKSDMLAARTDVFINKTLPSWIKRANEFIDSMDKRWEKLKTMIPGAASAVTAKINEWRAAAKGIWDDADAFYEKHKSWLKPMLIAGGAAAGAWAIKRMLSGDPKGAAGASGNSSGGCQCLCCQYTAGMLKGGTFPAISGAPGAAVGTQMPIALGQWAMGKMGQLSIGSIGSSILDKMQSHNRRFIMGNIANLAAKIGIPIGAVAGSGYGLYKYFNPSNSNNSDPLGLPSSKNTAGSALPASSVTTAAALAARNTIYAQNPGVTGFIGRMMDRIVNAKPGGAGFKGQSIGQYYWNLYQRHQRSTMAINDAQAGIDAARERYANRMGSGRALSYSERMRARWSDIADDNFGTERGGRNRPTWAGIRALRGDQNQHSGKPDIAKMRRDEITQQVSRAIVDGFRAVAKPLTPETGLFILNLAGQGLSNRQGYVS
jgi:hypothetical protein